MSMTVYRENSERDSDNQADISQVLKDLYEGVLLNFAVKGIKNISSVVSEQSPYNQWTDNGRESTEYVLLHDSRTPSEWVLTTEGTNLRDIMGEEVIDFPRLYSNDINEILEIFGIEATRRALFKEIRNILSFDGSYVNYRHIALLVDYMTYKGRLVPITRHGINRVDSGPLQRASFEETLDVLFDAAAYAEKDKMLGVSENIMLGQFIPTGTGAFDVLLDATKLADVIESDQATIEAGALVCILLLE